MASFKLGNGVNEQKGETEPDDNKIIDGKPENDAAAKKAYKRADVDSPYAVTESVQKSYDAAVKKAYGRASTGKNNDDGGVNGS